MYASFFFYRLGKRARELCIIINNITYVIFFYKYRAHICRSFQHPRCNLHIYVDTLHIYVHMQLNYVGMQITGTYVAFWKNVSYKSWEGQTYTNSWQANFFKKIKVGTWGGGGG